MEQMINLFCTNKNVRKGCDLINKYKFKYG